MGSYMLILCVFFALTINEGTPDWVESFERKGVYKWPNCDVTLSCKANGLYRAFHWSCSGCPSTARTIKDVPGFAFKMVSDFPKHTSSLRITKCYRELIISCSVDSSLRKSITLSLDSAGCNIKYDCGYLRNGFCLNNKCKENGCYINAHCGYLDKGFCLNNKCIENGCNVNANCGYLKNGFCLNNKCKESGCNVNTDCGYLNNGFCLNNTCKESGCNVNADCGYLNNGFCLNNKCIDSAGCKVNSDCGYLSNGVCSKGKCKNEGQSDQSSRGLSTWHIVVIALVSFGVFSAIIGVLRKNRLKKENEVIVVERNEVPISAVPTEGYPQPMAPQCYPGYTQPCPPPEPPPPYRY